MSLASSMSETAQRMREQGTLLIRTGQELMRMGEQQLSAAETLDVNMRAIYPEQNEVDHRRPLERLLPDEVISRREYMPVVDAAHHILLRSGPMERAELFEKISQFGVRCRSEQSLHSMLGQNPDRFLNMGSGRWAAIPTHSDRNGPSRRESS